METGLGLFARIGQFALALWPYWWLLVPGGIFAIEPMTEGLLPDKWQKAVNKRWPRSKRHRHFRLASIAAVFIASFMAFDDVNVTNAKLQKQLSALEHSNPVQQSTIDRLSGDLTTERGQIDTQEKLIKAQEEEIARQKQEIAALQPKPARHLTDDDRKHLDETFNPIKADFPNLAVFAPADGEAQGYAKELADEFNKIGIKVGRIAIIFPTSARSFPLLVAYKDGAHIPPKAEKFAEAMERAGFKVQGGTLDTLGGDGFALIVSFNR